MQKETKDILRPGESLSEKLESYLSYAFLCYTPYSFKLPAVAVFCIANIHNSFVLYHTIIAMFNFSDFLFLQYLILQK